MIAAVALIIAGDLSSIVAPNAKLELVATGFQFTEGPVWTPRGSLIFSDIPGDTLYEFTDGGVTVFRRPSHNANGNNLDQKGRLLTCHHGTRNVTRSTSVGAIEVIADKFQGKRLNSPNDVVAHRDGSIYFTDPDFGVQPNQRELPFCGVYRVAPNGKITLVAKDFAKPNGLAFSPDYRKLYIDDTERRHIRVFDVLNDGTLGPGKVFASFPNDKPGAMDGMRVDSRGNVYCTCPGGLAVIAPSGSILGVIDLPKVATNCAWGDRDFSSLYITAQDSVYRIRMKSRGAKL